MYMTIDEKNKVWQQFAALRQDAAVNKPLVHCITHGITMNDSANVILAVGGIPNMASHPKEVVEVGKAAAALVVNLGNISSERMEAMMLAGQAAHKDHIPILIDLVGVACSTLRRDFAKQFIHEYHPQIIKGNSSEIRAICGLPSHAVGVDAGAADAVTAENFRQAAQDIQAYALAQHAVLLMSGPVDVITDGKRTCGVANGTAQLARLTGTGCMLGALAGVYIASRMPWEAAVLSAVMMGIAGEEASRIAGTRMGTFHMALLDAFSMMTDTHIQQHMKLLF